MIIKSQQVVSHSDSPVPFSDFTSSVLGLLTVERTFRLHGLEHLYTFPHLTFQEYLAAFHIAGLEEREQINIISRYTYSSDNLKNVNKFYCGLLGLEKSMLLKNNLQRLLDQVRFLSSHQLQCAFESQQLELCDYIVRDGSIKLDEFMTPSDFAALGYVISTASQHVSVLDLKYCTWDYDGVMAFSSMDTSNKLHSIKCLKVGEITSYDMCKALNSLLLQFPLLEKLDLHSDRPDQFHIECIECLTSNITLSNLTCLKIDLPLAPCSHPEKVLQSLAFGSHNIKQVHCWWYGNTNFAMWRKWLCYAFDFQVYLDNDISWVHLYNSESFSSLLQERFINCSEVVLVNCGIDDKGAQILAIRLNPAVLEKLVLDFNRISDSGAVPLAWCLAIYSVVQEVSIQCNSIGDLGAIALADTLVHCSSLRRLDLQGNGLGDEGAVAIAKATEALPNLDLYLHNVNITEEGVERVLEHRASTKIRAMVFGSSWDAISDAGIDTLRSALKCGTLPALKIYTINSYNIKMLVAELEHVSNISGLECDRVTDDTVPTLCGIVKSMNNLQHLKCSGIRYISSTSAQLLGDISVNYILLEAVKCCNSLRSLDMTHCGICSDGATSLFCDYKSWINLHTLNLCGNNIGSDGAQVLSKVLLHSKNIRYLDLSSNRLGDSGCLSLAEGLQNHISLLELKLGCNNITSEGIAAIIPVIKRNHIQHLDLSQCGIGSDGVAALVDAMCADTLQTLKLDSNGLSFNGTMILSDGLQRCRQLMELDVSNIGIGPCGMSYLFERLKYCRQLLKLDVSSNYFGSSGLSCVADGLQHCINLQVLRLGINKRDRRGNITSDSIDAITVIMKKCRYLQELDLSENSICVDGAAVLVGGWQHKIMLTLDLQESLGDPHESALVSVERCCSSCDHLLELYCNNDYVIIHLSHGWIPKLVSSS